MRSWTWAVLAGALSAAAPARADARLEEIREAIARERLEWTAGQIAVSRLSAEERQRRLAAAQPDFPTDFGAFSAPRLTPTRPSPTAIDWRNLHGYGFLQPARDQGACGSCWAFAMVGALEPLVAQRASNPALVLDLSEQQLLDCAASSLGCDSGGLTWGPPGAFVTREGLTEERCYPYVSGASAARGSCASTSGLDAGCREVVRAARTLELAETMPGFPQWNPPDFELSAAMTTEIKRLLETRPVGVTMRVFDDLYYYESGVYSPTSTATRKGLHAVVLVGYDDAEGAWVVRNSWGADWGEDGYGRIRYGASSIGMYAFAFEYEENRALPAFCTLPSALALDPEHPETAAALHLANCGGGVLAWQASLDEGWVAFETVDGAPVGSGRELAAGTDYRLRLTAPVERGTRAALTLSGTGQGPLQVAIFVGDLAEMQDELSEDEPKGCGCGTVGTAALLPGLGLLLLGASTLRRLRSR